MTQEEIIRAHLIEHESITSWQAIVEYRITRLSAIIYKLVHKYDMKIVSINRTEKRDGRTHKFTEYRLVDR